MTMMIGEKMEETVLPLHVEVAFIDSFLMDFFAQLLLCKKCIKFLECC